MKQRTILVSGTQRVRPGGLSCRPCAPLSSSTLSGSLAFLFSPGHDHLLCRDGSHWCVILSLGVGTIIDTALPSRSSLWGHREGRKTSPVQAWPPGGDGSWTLPMDLSPQPFPEVAGARVPFLGFAKGAALFVEHLPSFRPACSGRLPTCFSSGNPEFYSVTYSGAGRSQALESM